MMATVPPSEITTQHKVTRQIVERVDDPILVVRSDMTIAYANLAALALFGYKRSELYDQNVDVLVPKDRIAKHKAGAAKFWDEGMQEAELTAAAGITALHKDGREIPVEIRLQRIKGVADQLVVVVIREWHPKTPPVGWPGVIQNIKLLHLASICLLIMAALAGALAIWPPRRVFWFVNPLLISVGFGLIIAYANTAVDAWRNRRRGLTAGHLLSFGLLLNWTGLIMRQFAWYVGGVPPPDTSIYWWIVACVLSIIGGLLHIGAVEAVEATWAPRYFIMLAFIAMMGAAVVFFGGFLFW